MGQKHDIGRLTKLLEKMVRDFCKSQKSRWKELLRIAKAPENKFLAQEMQGMAEASGNGLYRISTDNELYLYVDLNTGNLVDMSVRRLSRKDVLLIASNIEAIDAQNILVKADMFIRKQARKAKKKTLPQSIQSPNS